MKKQFKNLFQFHIDPLEQYDEALRKIVLFILLFFSLLGLPLVVVGVVEAIQLKQYSTAWVYFLLFAPLWILLIFRKHIHYKLVAAFALLLIFALAAHNIVIYGFSGAGIPIFLTFFMLVTLFFGFRTGIISIVVAIIPFSVIGYMMVRKTISPDVDLMHISQLPISWITAISTMVLLGLVLVLSYSFLHFNLLNMIDISRKQAEDLRKMNADLLKQIDEKERILSDLEKAKERAVESDRLKSAFLANISHEIRTPMNGILGFTSLLKSKELKQDKQKRYIEIIENSGKRMLNLINDLIDISKIEAGQVEVHLSEIDVNEQLNTLFQFFLPSSKLKGLELTFSPPATDQRVLIKTDEVMFISILTNLINNAIKYTPGGEIAFGYILKDRTIGFFVKDTGIGIPADKQEMIFNRFVQADSSYNSGYEGAGLGLAITKNYVELLGGTIWLESEDQKGATFYFDLPLSS